MLGAGHGSGIWRRSNKWRHRLGRLDDRCPDLCNRWLTGSVGLHGLGVLMIVLAELYLVDWSAAGLVMQELVS